MKYKRPLVFVGSRSNMEPLIELANTNGYKVIGILDRFYVGKQIEGIDVIGSDLDLVVPSTPAYDLIEHCDFFVASYFSGTTNTNNNNENTFFLRQQRINLVEQAGCNLANLIHPDVEISASVKLGRNILILKNVIIESHVTISSFTTMMYHTCAAHHSNVGKNCTLMPDSAISGSADIGNNVLIGVNTRILNTQGRNTRIGHNTIIGPGLHILKDIADNSIVRVDGKIIENKDYIADAYGDLAVSSNYRRLTKETQNETI